MRQKSNSHTHRSSRRDPRSGTKSKGGVFARAFERTLSLLTSAGRQVIVVQQVPETGLPIPVSMARAKILGRNIELRPSRADYAARQAFVNEVMTNVLQRHAFELIRPEARLCPDEYCMVALGGTPDLAGQNAGGC